MIRTLKLSTIDETLSFRKNWPVKRTQDEPPVPVVPLASPRCVQRGSPSTLGGDQPGPLGPVEVPRVPPDIHRRCVTICPLGSHTLLEHYRIPLYE